MTYIKLTLVVSVVLLSVGCSSLAQTAAPSSTPNPSPTASSTVTSLPQATATFTPAATATPPQTDTPVPTEPEATLDPTPDAQQATMVANFGSMGELMNMSLYFNPVGTPLQSWHNIPIMAQATAGQEFNPNVYSYIAAATLDQAQAFYLARAASLGLVNAPATGTSGSGDQAMHDATFFSYALTIMLNSYDNDTSHVIVIIAALQ